MAAIMTKNNIPIGEVLKEYGYITEQQLAEALAYQQQNRGKRLGQVLVDRGYVSEKQVLEALSRRMDVRMVDVANAAVDLEAVRQVPKKLAEKYLMLPVAATDTTLSVVTNDPLNFYAQEDVRQLTGKQLEILLAEAEPLRRAIERYYAEISVRLSAERANVTTAAPTVEELGVGDTDGDDDAPVIRLLATLIQRGCSVNASDIHIEPFEDKTAVRMRIDGTIVEVVTLQREVHASLIARIKILSNLDIAERRVPQDGHFRYKLDSGEYINIRVSVIPTVFGEKAVLRLLMSARHIDHQTTFGMTGGNYEKFMKMLNSPNGIVYITGPTGSGKTTTLYMVLEYLSARKVNITTIEDPVEKNIAHINQTQVNNVAGLTFDTGMRALLRQDPDIIMVGETRDTETADTSVRAAITGHLVFSTLHTNSAVSSIIRLADMGIQNYMIANSLVGIVAQRLMRKVCPYCGELVDVVDAERELVGEDVRQVKRAVGCPRCNHTGYTGRTAIHEVVFIDKTIRGMISRNATMEEIEQYAISGQGMELLRDSGRALVRDGVTTVEELMKVAYYS